MNKISKQLYILFWCIGIFTMMNCKDVLPKPEGLSTENIDEKWEGFFSCMRCEEVLDKLRINTDKFKLNLSSLKEPVNSNLLTQGIIRYLAYQPEYNVELLKVVGDKKQEQYSIGQLIPEISKLTSLETMVLDGIGISELPNEIKSLTRLRKVSLSKNNFQEFPIVLAGLTNIKNLNLSENSISQFPKIVHVFPNLTTLCLNGNPLYKLPDYTNILFPRLKNLLLANTHLQELHPRMLRSMVNLKSLDLNNNQLERLPISTYSILTGLRGLLLKLNPWFNDKFKFKEISKKELEMIVYDEIKCRSKSVPRLFTLCLKYVEDNLGLQTILEVGEILTYVNQSFRDNLFYWPEGKNIVCLLKLRQRAYPFYLDYPMVTFSDFDFVRKDLKIRLKNIRHSYKYNSDCGQDLVQTKVISKN